MQAPHRTGMLVLSLTVLVLHAVPTQGDVIHVPADYPTIQGGIDAAVDGDEIIVAPGRYVELIDFLGKVIWLHSSEGPDVTIMSGLGLEWSVVSCLSGEGPDTVLEGFTVRDGTGTYGGVKEEGIGGGMFNENSSPTIRDCIFRSNPAFDSGGMRNRNSNPTVINCEFRGNSVRNGSGGMGNSNSNPLLINCTFVGNSAHHGAGMDNNFSNPTLINCAFRSNSAYYDIANSGGGMENYQSSPTITGCLFIGNQSDSGGGMSNWSDSNPLVIDCTFIGNRSEGFYGSGGGGIYNASSNPMIVNCTFIENIAQGLKGGGIYNVASSPIVANSRFVQNSASAGGGVYSWHTSGNPSLINCTFTGNEARRGGGGIAQEGGSTTVTNCAFTGNTAELAGGAMFFRNGSAPVVTNCTFAQNAAPDGLTLSTWPPQEGGPCDIDMINCILWNGGNEIENGDSSSITISYSDVHGGFSGEGNIDLEPMFVDPANNDYRLRSHSPCSDAGDNTAVPADVADLDADEDTEEPTPFDLDGNPRFVDNPCMADTGNCGTCELPMVDMGAYEVLAGVSCCLRDPEWLCDGDLDGDGQVNPTDLGRVQANFGNTSEQALCNYDLDCDRQINPVDAGIVQSLFGTCEAPREVCP